MNAKVTLESIHKHPGMYWGGSEHLFTSWVSFQEGFKIGYEMALSEHGTKPQELVPLDFHKFVTEWFGRKFPDSGNGWMTFIRMYTSSEQEAFELFFQLRAEYDRSNAA